MARYHFARGRDELTHYLARDVALFIDTIVYAFPVLFPVGGTYCHCLANLIEKIKKRNYSDLLNSEQKYCDVNFAIHLWTHWHRISTNLNMVRLLLTTALRSICKVCVIRRCCSFSVNGIWMWNWTLQVPLTFNSCDQPGPFMPYARTKRTRLRLRRD